MKIILALLLLSGCMPNGTKVKNEQPTGPTYNSPPPQVYCQWRYLEPCGWSYTNCTNGLEYHCVGGR